jgi:hydrogenase expression/formation protein HypD
MKYVNEFRDAGLAQGLAARIATLVEPDSHYIRFDVPGVRVAAPKACQRGEVLKEVLKPWQCRVFGTACGPEKPPGTVMVSSEGACAAYFNFGRTERQRAGAEA